MLVSLPTREKKPLNHKYMPGLITELSTILIIFAYFCRGQDPDFKSTMDNYACSMRTRKKDI